MRASASQAASEDHTLQDEPDMSTDQATESNTKKFRLGTEIGNVAQARGGLQVRFGAVRE